MTAPSADRGKVHVTLVHDASDPVVAEVFGRLAQGTVGVVNIHRTLANSPEVFARFIDFAHALRFKTTVAPAERELAILLVLGRHGGHYEEAHHRRMALAAGATDAQVAGVTAIPLDAALYDERTRALLAFADAFAEGAGADEGTRTALARHFDNRQIVEVTLTLSLYLGLSHLTQALDVPVD